VDYSVFPFIGQGIFLTSLIITCVKIFRTKSSRDFSFPAVVWSTTGILALLIYANHLRVDAHQNVLFYTYSVNFASNLVYLWLVFRYRHGK
jgi:uncharacterized protein with PQ loop repeat